jgi:hypothetical protein
MHKATGRFRHLVISITKIIDWSSLVGEARVTSLALCNQLRGLLRERRMVVRTGAAALKRSLPAALADESSELSGEMRALLSEMSQRLRTLEQRIDCRGLRGLGGGAKWIRTAGTGF